MTEKEVRQIIAEELDKRDRFLTVEEFCKKYNKSRATVWKWRKVGAINSKKINGTIMIQPL